MYFSNFFFSISYVGIMFLLEAALTADVSAGINTFDVVYELETLMV